MAWYQKNTTPEWKLFIDKPYTVQSLLLNKDLILKELPQQKEIQNYLINHKHRILSQCLRFCLLFPEPDASYDRKYLLPTKAIQLMTNEVFFSSLGWDTALIKMYFHEMMKNFLSVDHHLENINLYHAYFERLLRMLMRSNKLIRSEVIQIVEQQQRVHGFVCELMKHSHKYSIVTCFLQFINLDMLDSTIYLSCEIKKEIIGRSLECLEQYTLGQRVEVEKIENMLILNKIYLEQSIKFLLTSVPNTDRKVQDFTLIYQMFQTKYPALIQIIKQQQTSLQMVALQIVQLNEILHIRARNRQIESLWTNTHRQDLINFVIGQKVGLIYPLFIQWLIILFSDVGESHQKIEILCRTNILAQMLKILINHKSNSIIVVRIIQLLKVLFMNIQKEVILNIEANKNIDINRIQFKLLQQFFKHMPTIEGIIKQFKSYNELLFTNLVKLIKVYYQYAVNIDSIFNHYSAFSICQQKRHCIIKLMEFYQKQSCFQLYDHQISKELGTFFDDSLFNNIVPSEYQVVRKDKPIGNLDNSNIEASVSEQSTLRTSVLGDSTQANAIPLIDKAAIEIKLNDDLIPHAIEEDKQQPKQIQNYASKVSNEVPSAIEMNNMQDLQQSYESYMKKKMKQAQKILTQKRSKSRTPTKIKNQLKKSKNRWATNTQAINQDENCKSFSCQNKDAKLKFSLSPPKIITSKESLPQKISIIRLNEKKKPKVYRQRAVDSTRDSRLQNWLSLLKNIR